MYNNILVPVIFDEAHRPVKSFAVAKAIQAEGGKITLLHVFEELPSYATQYLPQDHMDSALGEIKGLLKSMADGIPNCSIEVVHGHSARSILDYAEGNGVDCIIVASHKPGVQDYFLGGTAARVVRYAQCAVHVVR